MADGGSLVGTDGNVARAIVAVNSSNLHGEDVIGITLGNSKGNIAVA